ncbi:hypothetical protein SAMN04488136_10890 [Vibrio xiamenensis]|uniref:Thrombospondin type 3 repeat-containing protein n=1 Tax=Vibrio xiamenensis TaxID=861298 RepID=A0A1G7ZPC4_9VIBR|nr:hypothetical protein [Vibrio xiamenensis]SDH10528.1 hypothetical protein SAMN04488136_10890 [Vibrio xiamenensis]
MHLKASKIALAVCSTLALNGCWWDSDSSSSSASTSSTYSVKAIDGYLVGATVWLDLDGDFALDDNEPSATSTTGGSAVLDVSSISNPEDYSVVVSAIQDVTIDEDTGNTVSANFSMSAPAGVVNITPLSTLVHIKIASSGLTLAQAQQEIADDLGIDSGDVLTDYKASDSKTTQFAARSLVSSGAMPETTDELNTAANDTDGTNDLLDGAAAMAVIIKQQVEGAENEDDLDAVYINRQGAVDSDSDGDGVADTDDAFPDDENEWVDTDGDDLGNNADTDDDGDGVLDTNDDFPLDATEDTDTDSDGIGNNTDDDDDNDGVLDTEDAFPEDSSESVDTDNDGTGNNADTDDDGDGVPDEYDEDPIDPEVGASSQTAIISYLQDQASLYSIWDDEDDDGTQTLYLETLSVNGDYATSSDFSLIKANKTTVSLGTSEENDDLILTSSGWSTSTGSYTIDMSGSSVVAYPTDYTDIKYTLNGTMVTLDGGLVSDVDWDWEDYSDDTATFPDDSVKITFTVTPQQDNYYIWDWMPYIYDAINGVNAEGATSFDELLFSDLGGSSITTDQVQGFFVGNNRMVKLVDNTAMTAQYYTVDWDNNLATLDGSGTWSQETISGEELILFTLPEDVLTTWGDDYDEPSDTMLLSIYEGAVYIGSKENADVVLEDDQIVIISAAAKDALIDAVNIPVNKCNESDTDGTTTVTLEDFEAAISDCYGATAITSDMVSDQNFHRVRSDGSTRDYTFNSDGTVTVFKDSVQAYTAYWAIEGDYVKVTYEDSTDESWYWALIDSNDSEWSLKFFDTYYDSDTLITEIWSSIVTLVDAGTCAITEGLDMTYSDFTTAIDSYATCSGTLPTVIESDLDGAALFRVKSNGETRLYSFNADGTATYHRDGLVRSRTWAINDDGFIVLMNLDGGTEQYLALLQEPQNDVLNFAVFSPDDTEIWLTTYTSIDGEPAITSCTDSDTQWDDVNDVPETTLSYADFTSAVDACIATSGVEASFSSDFLAELPLTMSSTESDSTEVYTFSDATTGTYSEGGESYDFTWQVDDSTGELTVTITANSETYVDQMYIVDTDGINFSVKAMSRSSAWDEGLTGEGDVWSDVYVFAEAN